MEEARSDQRRETGLRTQARLLDAALDLLSARGEDGVTLRELTNAAGANVAAVSYHYGSLKALCDVAVEHALERYLDAQQEALDTLDAEPTVEDVAAAFARPMIRALATGGKDLAALRIVARAAIDPPQAWDRFDARFVDIRTNALRLLKTNVPGVKEKELLLRVRCVAGMLNWLALAPVSGEIRTRSETQLAQLLVPIIAGAFRGTGSG
jgi:AcrR family transcriptional regulator